MILLSVYYRASLKTQYCHITRWHLDKTVLELLHKRTRAVRCRSLLLYRCHWIVKPETLIELELYSSSHRFDTGANCIIQAGSRH